MRELFQEYLLPFDQVSVICSICSIGICKASLGPAHYCCRHSHLHHWVQSLLQCFSLIVVLTPYNSVP